MNRPDFREMSPGCAKAYSGGTQICGAPDQITNPEYDAANPDPDIPIKIDYHLHRAEIHNVDLRSGNDRKPPQKKRDLRFEEC